MEHNGFSYTTKSRYNGTVYYVCSHFRSAGCNARLIVKSSGIIHEANSHSCVRQFETVNDVTAEMKEMLEETATTEMAMPPSRVWSSVVATLHEKYGATATLRLLPRQTAVTFVKSVRRDLTGGDVFRAIELTPTSQVGADDERPFLQFHYVYAYAGSHKRMVGFAHPDLLRLLKYPNNPLFVDCTFKVCPKPFSQVAIIMGYDPAYDLYLPIFYVLLQGKEQATYWHMFDMVIMQCDLQVEPRTVTCDFELGLLNAVREQFPGIPVVGCLFHWKQALRRKMLHLRIPTDVVSDVMRRGVIDVLTVIPPEDIVSKGIPFVRSKIDETGHRVKWDTFWRYFKRTWMTQYDTTMWNVHNISTTGGIVNRTNNALEKFNRDLNESFPTAHPSLLTFIDVIKRKSREYVALLDDIRHGRQVPPAHGTTASTVVPGDYHEFCSQLN